jgi:hypothetical protein
MQSAERLSSGAPVCLPSYFPCQTRLDATGKGPIASDLLGAQELPGNIHEIPGCEVTLRNATQE